MRRLTMGAAVLAAVVLAGCGAEEPAPAPETTTAAETPAAADGEPIRAAFESANQSAAWYDNVAELKLDGLAVIVHTTASEVDEPTALAMCEAAYSAAESTGVEFRSVAVRSADDSTLTSRNKLTGATACESLM